MDIDYILDIAARSISSKGRKKRNGGSIILFCQNEEKKSINIYEIDRDYKSSCIITLYVYDIF